MKNSVLSCSVPSSVTGSIPRRVTPQSSLPMGFAVGCTQLQETLCVSQQRRRCGSVGRPLS